MVEIVQSRPTGAGITRRALLAGTAAGALAAGMPKQATPDVDPVGGEEEDEDGFLSVGTLRAQYLDYLTAKQLEIEEQKQSRRYYHGAQWTAQEIEILRARRQPVITYNRTSRKINGIVGLTERMRQDPKAFPKTPRGEQGAEVATETVKTILSASEWKTLDGDVTLQCAIEGIGGVEMKLVEGDQGDPDIRLAKVMGDDYFYDPRSVQQDFLDRRFEGIAKWVDVDEAVELFPDQEETIRGLIENGSDLTTYSDREFRWINITAKRVRLVEHWYKHRGRWCWAFYISFTLLDQGVSPFRDENRKTMSRFIMWSAAVDQDGDRYGFVRNLKGPQDEINQRRSKALHISNSRRLIGEKGAVDDVERARVEWARPDGFIERNPGKELKPDDTQPDLAAQLQFLTEAKEEINEFANVNPATLSQGTLQNLSGRAINLLQQPGLAELGPFLLAYRGWKMRVYRACWNTAQLHWTAERWLRVTDDDGIARFIEINGLELDDFGRPALVNALGSLDVDILMDEGPDVVSLLQDTYDVLRNQPPGTVPPQVLLELSPIQASQKKRILQMLQPPPPDPLEVLGKQLTVDGLAASNEAARAVAAEKQAGAIQKRAAAINQLASAAEAASKAELNTAEVARTGAETIATLRPEPPDLGPGMTVPASVPQPQYQLPFEP